MFLSYIPAFQQGFFDHKTSWNKSTRQPIRTCHQIHTLLRLNYLGVRRGKSYSEVFHRKSGVLKRYVFSITRLSVNDVTVTIVVQCCICLSNSPPVLSSGIRVVHFVLSSLLCCTLLTFMPHQ